MKISIKSNYYINSFLWGVVNRLSAAIINFFSVPILMKYFGVDNFGVFSIVMSLNVFINLLDLGLNVGCIKFYSKWKEEGNYDKIAKIVSTSLSLYSLLGLFNVIILLVISCFPGEIFNLPLQLTSELRVSLWILALFCIPSWLSSVYYQLLVAFEKIEIAHKLNVIVQLFKLGAILLTVFLKLSFTTFFFLYTLSAGLLFLMYYLVLLKNKITNGFSLGFYLSDFKEVLNYSLGIFCYSLFSVIATQSRPLVLGVLSNDATTAVSQYKVLEAFPLFIISLGGLLSSIILPKSSKIIHNEDVEAKKKLAYEGTLFSTILCCSLCFPVMINAQDILNCYVGDSFSYLANGLVFWCLTVLVFLHSTPCNSLILAVGRTKLLILTTFSSCFISLTVNIVLVPEYGIWSILVGYFVYIFLQMLFQYLIFYPKILKIDPFKVFLSFIKPVLVAVIVSLLIVYFVNPDISVINSKVSLIAIILVKAVIFYVLFFLLLKGFKIIKLDSINFLQR